MKTRAIEFYSCGTKIVGNVNLPDDYKEGTKLPCIIPCSGFTGINAVYPSLMSRLFTAHGYACVAFDYRGWAPSEGEVGVTSFDGEYEDIEAAYIFAQQQPEIDPDNIALFGWGMAAPIVIKVGAYNRAIKCVGVGNGFYNGERMARVIFSPEEYKQKEKAAHEDYVRRVLTGKTEKINCYAFMNSDTNGGQSGYIDNTLDNLTDELPAILERDYGGKDNFPPKHSWAYWDYSLRVDAEEYVHKLAPRGLFIAYGKNDMVYDPYEARCLFAAAGEGKVLYEVDGCHNDWMFDRHPEFVKFGQALVRFYDSYMK